MTKQKKRTKYEYIGELLRNLGLGLIDIDRFWRDMAKQRLTDEDVEKWCVEYHRREQENVARQGGDERAAASRFSR